MRHLTAVMFVAALAVLAPKQVPAETVIVTNPSSRIADLSEDEIRAIFLGKMTRLSDGKPITIFIQGDGPAHDDVLAKLLNKSDAQFMSYWARRVFSGKSAPPMTLGSDAEVVAYIHKQEGGIGYVSKETALRSDLKIVYTIP